MAVPKWLDSDYVQTILRKAEKDDSIRVSSLSVKPAIAKGENYASDLYRLNVDYSRILEGRQVTESKSVITKVATDGGCRDEMARESRFFEIEMSMMSETLPRMQEILTSHGMSASLSAQCLHIQEADPKHLFLEDLLVAGFRLADRRKGLDLDHCLVAMRNLAKFHAASVALGEKDLQAVKKYNKGMFDKNQCNAVIEFYPGRAKMLAEEVANWPELSPRIRQKLAKLPEGLYERGCEAALLREDDFNVLTHGDVWTNNMMFRYDENHKPIDHRFLDFQISNYASPVLDLLYFFATSPNDDVRKQHRELIVREYHAALTTAMAQLKCSTAGPSLEYIMDSLRKRALFEVILTFSILPLALFDLKSVISPEEAEEYNVEHERLSYKGELFRKVMTRILPLYDSMGLLDTQNGLRFIKMAVPMWLNSDYIKAVLRKVEKNDSIEVSDMTVKPATANGDNYMSDMHRIGAASNSCGFLTDEISMMSETLPRMQEILSRHGMPASLSARCLPTQEEGPIHLLLEDLVAEGFRLADRQAGLDLDHCLVAIRNLANFHASSVALAEKDLAAVTKYNKGNFHKDHVLIAFFESTMKYFAEEVAKWPELNPRIYNKILKLSEVVREKLCEAALFRENDFNVLNHGDFWINNIMFRYDDQQNPVDSRFVSAKFYIYQLKLHVDFQLSNYASPAIDILFFFGTSLSDVVREQHRELIVREYHASLTATMAKLKCVTVVPSLDQLLDTLKKRALCEVVTSFTLFPMILVDKSNFVSLDDVMKGGGGANSIFQGDLFRKVMKKILPLYDSMGLLDTTSTS
nr:uncharacterized protein LOC124222317 [Neodiprion pinetum]